MRLKKKRNLLYLRDSGCEFESCGRRKNDLGFCGTFPFEIKIDKAISARDRGGTTTVNLVNNSLCLAVYLSAVIYPQQNDTSAFPFFSYFAYRFATPLELTNILSYLHYHTHRSHIHSPMM